MYRVIYAVLLRRIPPEEAHRGAFWLIRAAAGVPGLAWALRRVLGPRDPVAAGAGARAGLPRAARACRRVRQGRGGRHRAGGARVLVHRGRHRDRAAAAGQPEAADVPVHRRTGPGQPDGVQQPRGGGAVRPAAGAARRARASSRSSASTSARRRPCPRKRRSPTTSPAPAWSPTSPTTWSSTSARPTPLACATCRRPTSSGRILAAVRAALDEASPRRRVPLLVKIAPDLADPDVDAVADLALELGLDGIIATNTTISRDGPARQRRRRRRGPWRPVRRPAEAALARGAAPGCTTGAASASRSSRPAASRPPADAEARLAAGATLLQAYTAFIYEGPCGPATSSGAWPPGSARASPDAPAVFQVCPAARLWHTPGHVFHPNLRCGRLLRLEPREPTRRTRGPPPPLAGSWPTGACASSTAAVTSG